MDRLFINVKSREMITRWPKVEKAVQCALLAPYMEQYWPHPHFGPFCYRLPCYELIVRADVLCGQEIYIYKQTTIMKLRNWSHS